jgi:acetyl esterase/lipase
MSTQLQSLYLEPAAQAFADANANPPFLYNLGPEQGRIVLDQVQSSPVAKPAVDIQDLTIAGGPTGRVSVRILRPQNAPPTLPVILFMHGAGWVFGGPITHDLLVRQLAVGANAAVVFPDYSRAPEVRYPVPIEECYAVLNWIVQQGRQYGLNSDLIATAGDSAGGNLASAVTILAKQRSGPKITRQLLFYPVADANFDTKSYHEFAEGFHLRREGMLWFWDQYAPNLSDRDEITASPLRATVDQLKGLPPTLVITAEADVLRDEGEAYANKLREAGVNVTALRFLGTIHDFVILNALADTTATRGAINLANLWLREGFTSRT